MLALAFLLYLINLIAALLPYVLCALGVLLVIGLIVRRRENK